ncbi:MAG: cyanophycinase [Gemmatimonadales bacterium]|nr:MAG: cyanophycinase [Gemmatimonadales bacterium]
MTVASGRTRDGLRRGFIIPIGGAERKVRDRDILTRFVDMCGGEQARIAVIPTASELPETGPTYERLFEEIGVEHVRNFPFETRADCDSNDWLEELERSTGVFMTGGNQLRLSTTIGGTKVGSLLRALSMRGAHIAGTSAGAGFLSEHMIAFGSEGPSPRANMVTLAPGLGLTNAVIVDHHFRARDRIGRLMTAVSYNPFAIGLGLDEDTAAFISPDDVLEVDGSGSVTVVDPSEVEYTSMDSAYQNDPVCLVGLRVHILTRGWQFDLRSRCASAPKSQPNPAEALAT